jgi:hypothetical protein
MPASPSPVGEYLADLGEGYARATLRRKVAAIARACRLAGQPLDTRHPAIRDVLRGINRTHGSPAKRAQALDIDDLRKLVATCEDSLAGLRDGALLLLIGSAATALVGRNRDPPPVPPPSTRTFETEVLPSGSRSPTWRDCRRPMS